MKERQSFHLFFPAIWGERQGRDDAANEIVDSDPLTAGLQVARQDGHDDPDVISDMAIEYQRSYEQSYHASKGKGRRSH